MIVTVHHGDCRSVLPTLGVFDSCVCDPPYEIGFMGRQWDNTGVAFQADTWRLVYDRLKPGGFLAAFGGTRTYHRMACAIEDAGFEVRDSLMWIYGTGFPKSLDVSKAIDKAAGAVREQVAPRSVIGHQRNIGNRRPYMDDPNHTTDSDTPATPDAARWQGWGTALKPAWEPIILARKPLVGTVAANVLAHGVGGINIDACRVPGEFTSGWSKSGSKASENIAMSGANYARDPEPDSTIGRWPANVIHDGSPEVLAAFGQFGESKSPPVGSMGGGSNKHSIYGEFAGQRHSNGHGDSGTAARFFSCCPWSEDDLRFHYSAKADASDRAWSKHPTVKPLDLMRWLCRLITPPGGHILDPFAGSGTTGEAARAEGFSATLIEREAEYVSDIHRRLGRAEGADTPLFAGSAA